MGTSPGVSYRAVDGALIVVYGSEELRVGLPGWSSEEVHLIVESIQLGDWTPFHEVMSWENTRMLAQQVHGVLAGDNSSSDTEEEMLELEPIDVCNGSPAGADRLDGLDGLFGVLPCGIC